MELLGAMPRQRHAEHDYAAVALDRRLSIPSLHAQAVANIGKSESLLLRKSVNPRQWASMALYLLRENRVEADWLRGFRASPDFEKCRELFARMAAHLDQKIESVLSELSGNWYVRDCTVSLDDEGALVLETGTGDYGYSDVSNLFAKSRNPVDIQRCLRLIDTGFCGLNLPWNYLEKFYESSQEMAGDCDVELGEEVAEIDLERILPWLDGSGEPEDILEELSCLGRVLMNYGEDTLSNDELYVWAQQRLLDIPINSSSIDQWILDVVASTLSAYPTQSDWLARYNHRPRKHCDFAIVGCQNEGVRFKDMVQMEYEAWMSDPDEIGVMSFALTSPDALFAMDAHLSRLTEGLRLLDQAAIKNEELDEAA
ncbi:MAG: hypothetical protein C9356_14995 [Oleiphilus sp.]|nr:MAG: hypothetical protein C9356_14995 [Oleiphilus sp.]